MLISDECESRYPYEARQWINSRLGPFLTVVLGGRGRGGVFVQKSGEKHNRDRSKSRKNSSVTEDP